MLDVILRIKHDLHVYPPKSFKYSGSPKGNDSRTLCAILSNHVCHCEPIMIKIKNLIN